MQSHANLEKTTPSQAMLEAICKGEAGTYQQFSEKYYNLESYQQLANYLLNSPSNLDTIEISALIEIADLIENHALTHPQTYSKNTAIHVLLEAATKRGSAVACITMGKLAKENFQYDVAEAQFKRAIDLKGDEAYYCLVKLYTLQGRYQEAKTILQGILAKLPTTTLSSNSPCREGDKATDGHKERRQIEKKMTRINQLAAIKTQRSYLRTLFFTQQCIIYFDLDDTLIKASRNPNSYYHLPFKQRTASKEYPESFIIGSRQEWVEIFTHLQARGFLIGLCTARKLENGKDEMYEYFLQQFGSFFAPEHILFTEHKSKALAIINHCNLHQINLQNALLVDDYKTNNEECAAYGIATIFVKMLSLKPHNFIAFKQHLLQRAQTMLEQRPTFARKTPVASSAHALLPPSKERKKPASCQPTSRERSPGRSAPLSDQEERRNTRKLGAG